MAGIDEVLERLVSDPDFRTALARDPQAALLPYDLTAEDIALLASRLDDADDAQRAVEQRTSKSALFAALSMLGDGGDHGVPGIGRDDDLSVAGDRPPPVGAAEYTQVPSPPAPPVPTPYPNTAEAEVAMESLELSAEGFEAGPGQHEVTHVQQQGESAGTAKVGSVKYGDITLKRGLTEEPATAPDDLVQAGDGVSEVGGDLTEVEIGVDVEGETTDADEMVAAGDTLVHDWQPSGAGDGAPSSDVSSAPVLEPTVDDVLEIDDA